MSFDSDYPIVVKPYWTVRLEYAPHLAGRRFWPTESTGPFATLTRGAFRSQGEACIWASRELGPGPWMAVFVDTDSE
jgi:hypothetical protein